MSPLAPLEESVMFAGHPGRVAFVLLTTGDGKKNVVNFRMGG